MKGKKVVDIFEQIANAARSYRPTGWPRKAWHKILFGLTNLPAESAKKLVEDQMQSADTSSVSSLDDKLG